MCEYKSIEELQNLGEEQGIDRPDDSLPLSLKIRYYCYHLTQDKRYLCRNDDLLYLAENILDFKFDLEGPNRLVIDNHNFCYTMGELEQLANIRRFDLENIRHPFRGDDFKTLNLTFWDNQAKQWTTKDAMTLMHNLIKPKTIPKLNNNKNALIRILTEELNYGLDTHQSHRFAGTDEINWTADQTFLIINKTIKLGIIVLFQLNNELKNNNHFKKLIHIMKKNILYPAYSETKTYQMLIEIMHYFNKLYDEGDSMSFILNNIKFKLLENLKEHEVPNDFNALWGIHYFFS